MEIVGEFSVVAKKEAALLLLDPELRLPLRDQHRPDCSRQLVQQFYVASTRPKSPTSAQYPPAIAPLAPAAHVQRQSHPQPGPEQPAPLSG